MPLFQNKSKYLLSLFLCLIIIIINFNSALASKQQEIDSLQKLLKIKTGNEKTEIYNRLSSYFWFSNPDSAKFLSTQALNLSRKLNYRKGEGKSLNDIGVVFIIKNQNDSALYYLNEANTIFIEIKDTLNLANNFRAIADTYSQLKDNSKSQENYLKAFKLFENLKVDKDQIKDKNKLYNILLNNLGSFYIDIKNYQEAIKYFEVSLSNSTKNNELQGMCISNFNIGICYFYLKNVNKALENYKFAYSLALKTNNIKVQANSLQGIGEILFAQKKYKESLEYYNRTNILATQINDLDMMFNSHLAKSEVYFQLNQYMKAIKLVDTLNYIYQTNQNSMSKTYKLHIYSTYAKNYAKIGDYKNAHAFLYETMLLKDTLEKNENMKAVRELDGKFQLERKEKENSKLKYQNEISEIKTNKFKWLVFFLAITIALFFGLTYVLYRRHALKEKINIILKDKNDMIEEQNAQLQELNNTKDKFFSIIAHDLRSPFFSLRSYIQLLHKDVENMDKQEIKEDLKNLEDTAENIYKLMNNLLEWARMQRGLIPYKPENYQLNVLVDDTMSIIKDIAKQKEISLQCKIESDISIYVDASMFDTILRNLMTNAIKFTPRNGKITLETFSDSKFSTIKIQDTGIGMSPKIISNLFKTDEKVSRPGTEDEASSGLGLHLCKDFVERQGGKIWVESTENVGSIFYFTVPILQN